MRVLARQLAPRDGRTNRVITVLVSLFVLSGVIDAAAGLQVQSTPAWRHESSSEISRYGVAATGALLVVSDSGGLVALDPADGHQLWQRSDLPGFAGLGQSPLVMAGSWDGQAVLDLATGETRWTLDQLPLRQVYAWRSIPELNLLVVFGEGPETPTRVLGASLDSGIVRWQRDTMFYDVQNLRKEAGKLAYMTLQPPLRDTDSTLVLLPKHGGPMRLNLLTGELLWRADTLADEEPKSFWAGYAAMASDAHSVYVPHDKRVRALDRATGRVLWETQKYPSYPAQLVPTERGLVIRGYHRDGQPGHTRVVVDLVDPNTGASRWQKPQRDIHGASAMLIAGDTAYLASDEMLMALDLQSSTVRDLQALAWKGGEVPSRIERREGALLLSSSQTITRFDERGVTYDRYYSAPGASLFAKIVSTTLMAGVLIAGYSLAPSGTVMYVPSTSNPFSNPYLTERHKATVDAERYTHMLTSAPDRDGRKGFSVVRLDKDTGDEAGRVWVDSRHPDFTVDAPTGTVYLLREKHAIEAHRF